MALQKSDSLLVTPKVRVVGVQTVLDANLDSFLVEEGFVGYAPFTSEGGWDSDSRFYHGDGELLVEVAGRTCYMSFGGGRNHSDYIGNILGSGHGSVLEHAVINFLITGVDRSFTHELVRHRAGAAFSQLSQRYVDETKCQFVVPPALREEVDAAIKAVITRNGSFPEDIKECFRACAITYGPSNSEPVTAGLEWLTSMIRSKLCYERLSDYLYKRNVARRPSEGPIQTQEEITSLRKGAREASRSVLPGACETKVFLTLNGRALRHVLEMRGSEHADALFREVAVMMWQSASTYLPDILGDFETYIHPTAGVCLRSKYKKV